MAVNIRWSTHQNQENYQGKEEHELIERVNSPRRHNNLRYVCTKQENFKTHEAKTKQTAKRKEEIHTFGQGLLDSSLSSWHN